MIRRFTRWGTSAPCWLCLLVAFSACQQKIEVEKTFPRRGSIGEFFREPARTRLARTYLITMPISGRLGRLELDPGDPVQANQSLAVFDAVPLQQAVAEGEAAVAELEARIALLDDNRLENLAATEANSFVQAVGEVIQASQAQIDASQVHSENASRELARLKKLPETGPISPSQLDAAQSLVDTALLDLRKNQFYHAALHAMAIAVRLGPLYVTRYLEVEKLQRQVFIHQLAQAQARLAHAQYELSLAAIPSPITGIVLERYEQGNRTLPAGEPLLLLGNLHPMEAVAEVLTQDALRLSPGSRVELEPRAGQNPILGQVKRLEPAAFTKLSSLGVEQQRVKVILSLGETIEGLGVGYQLRARFFTATKDHALLIPRCSILQHPDGSFYVFRLVDNVLQKQPIRLGLQNDFEIEVIEGLSENEAIVANPNTSLEEHRKVVVRQKQISP